MIQKAAIPHLAPIDGLRAVAVLSVMAYHLRAGMLPGGFVGVDIFFVISGFVVSGALPATGISGIGPLLALFYGRRATRILPALYVCLLATCVLSVLFIPYSWLSAAGERSGLAAALGYSNFVLAAAEGNYFAPRADYNLFTHTWSLGVEEQFYAIFPWLFLPWLTGRRALSVGAFAVGLLFSLGYAWFVSTADEVAGFYLIFSRFWELALGVLAFQVSARAGAVAGGAARAVSIACAAVMCFALVLTTPDRTPFPGSLLPCLATAVLLVLVRVKGESAALRRVLTLPPVLYVGRISYSLYLWHWPVFVLFRWTVGLSNLAASLVAVLCAFGAAAASYRFVETPPRRALADGRVSSAVALAAAGVLVCGFYPLQQSIWRLRSTVSLSTVSRHRLDWYPDADGKMVSPAGCRVRVVPARAGDIGAQMYQRTACAAPDKAARALFIVGDSHAGAYSDFLARYVLTQGSAGMMYFEGGCAVLGLKPLDPRGCSKFLHDAIADVQQRVKPGDIVFLPGLRITRIAGQFVHAGVEHVRDEMFGAAQSQWRAMDEAATVPVLSRLVAAGALVVIEAPKPEFGAPTFRCADWYDAMNPICADGSTIRRSVIEDLRAPVMDEFRAVVAAVPGVRVWDPLVALCPGEDCSAYEGGKPLFFDGDHLSGYANRKLLPEFMGFLGRGAK